MITRLCLQHGQYLVYVGDGIEFPRDCPSCLEECFRAGDVSVAADLGNILAAEMADALACSGALAGEEDWDLITAVERVTGRDLYREACHNYGG